MTLTVVPGLQSEICVPRTPPPAWTPVTKPLQEMVIAIVTAGGVDRQSHKTFHLAGASSFRDIPGDVDTNTLMVTHGE